MGQGGGRALLELLVVEPAGDGDQLGERGDLGQRGRVERRPALALAAGHGDEQPLDGPEVVEDQRLVEAAGRSEEHTSELQSREKLVCRLLLEKTKRAPRA